MEGASTPTLSKRNVCVYFAKSDSMRKSRLKSGLNSGVVSNQIPQKTCIARVR